MTEALTMKAGAFEPLAFDVDKTRMELAEASYNFTVQAKNVILYQYILDNGVYGFSGY
ncbi:MAG: hypothetical protein GX936_07100 [Clostridiales bacterium]|jgi:hypothetical protein|nr:hypothetical protein [Clostridiales bacterium]